jgi:PAS domain S-box-containing protein
MKRLRHTRDLPAEESARRLRALLEAMQDLVLVMGTDGRYLDVAPTRPDPLYRPPEDILGKTVYDVFPYEQARFFHEAVERTAQTRRVVTVEYALPIGEHEVWFEARLSPMVDEDGKVSSILLVARDITALHRDREALREGEVQYRTLVEQSNAALYLLFDRRFVFVNRRFTELFGITPKDIEAGDVDFTALVAPQSRALIEERERKIARGEPVPLRYEFVALTKDGRELSVEASVAYIPYHGGIATQGVVQDIADRKRAEEQLARRDHYLACLADMAQNLLRAPDPFPILPVVLRSLGETAQASRAYLFANYRDAEGRLCTSQIVEWCAPGVEPQIDNPSLQSFPWEEAGFSRWVQQLSQNLVIVGDVDGFPEEERVQLEAEGITSILVLPLFVAGSWYGFIGFDICGATREWEMAEVDLLAAAANDIAQAIERKQAVEAMQESEERYRRLIELMPDGVAVHQDGVVRMANLAGARMLGYDSPAEVIGRPLLSLVHPEDRAAVLERTRALLQRGETVPPLEERFLRRDGSVIDVEVAVARFLLGGKPAVLVVVRDVAERLRLEEQLRQAQKMEAIGRLAGGISHDFNNLLTAINGYADLLLHTLDGSDPMRQGIEAISQAGRRAAGLTQQLLAFGRKQVMEMRVLDLSARLEDLASLLQRIIGEDIELLVMPNDEAGNVRVDPAQMEQVIVNLAVNARDAMPEGGRLTVALANVELDESYTQNHPEVRPGRYVLLSVSDTGRGLSPEARRHLFEPFFTTKETGTGLGLATVYGIVKQFEGHIQVYSEQGLGTTFKIYLPRVSERASPSDVLPTAGEWPRGSETVLVVEDNEMVRNLAFRVLSAQGYTVLEAERGDVALELAGAHREPIQLLLTDVVMPQMSGRVLLERIQADRPDIRVLYMSGYTDDVIAHHGTLEPGTPFLQKPFTPQALAQKVRAVLDA